MWESRSLRFPRAVGARGKPGFGFPRRPSGRHFHGSFRAYTVRVGLAVSASGFASPLTVSPSLAKTRVWGFGFENSNFPWRWSAVSSTSRWGYLPAYDRMASDRLDPRYFAGTGAGRFLTVDPYPPPDGMSNPGEWNRYSFVAGDPVNSVDPDGLVVIKINGAFNSNPDWIQADSEFSQAVADTFVGQTVVNWTWPGWGVTFFLDYAGIEMAGGQLASFINNY